MNARHLLAFPLFLLAACVHTAAAPSPASTGQARILPADSARLAARAATVTITRDDWGIAHVRGKTDADAVFGMMYAQAEDDFNRVETNFINAMGRLAETEGESRVWQDLRMKLFINPDTLQAMYGRSPAWLQALMVGWADGLNWYLATHPGVKPRVITHFEPWMALSFSEGSIGGDIESVSLTELQRFYSKSPDVAALDRQRATEVAREQMKEPTGSNGIALGPQSTSSHHAMLLINPHTSFYFRSEAQQVSDEGLDVYGASTWGQFFVYQGFNDRLGWMHTSSGVDVIDEFAETVSRNGRGFTYRYGSEQRPVRVEKVTVPYRTTSGMASRVFTVYFTHHGPVVREQDGKWIAVSLMNKPIEALSQSYLRTKARSLEAFQKVMELEANSSNNTLYADADGHFAYFHPQFVPKRDDRFDYTRPVDGSDPATDWHGLHALSELPTVIDPPNGWVYNSNNWPYTAAGPNSPRRESYPRYMDKAGENYRGLHALELLGPGRKDITLQGLIDIAYDSRQPFFAQLLPTLLDAYDSLSASDPLKARLADPIAVLRGWDYRSGVSSIPTSVAVYWGEELARANAAAGNRIAPYAYPAFPTTALKLPRTEWLAALVRATDRLTRDFGTWRTPWGEINRFQRLTPNIVQVYDDAAPSTPVGFTSALWGSLASFREDPNANTKRKYGSSGNSFVAAIEFARDSVHARAVTAGGESGHPSSRHFNDQAERYATGNLREVYFYPSEWQRHKEREYHPGH